MEETSLSQVLAKLLAREKMSMNAFAREINFPPPTIHRLLTGEVQDPKASTLNAIADYFQISIDQLLGKVPLENALSKPICSIPVLNLTEAKMYEKYLHAPQEWLRWQHKNAEQPTNIFAVLLKNNIYDPPFLNGTYLIVNPQITPHSGDYVLTNFNNDSEVVIKKYFSEGRQKYLYPLKQDLSSIPFDPKECGLIGVITEIYLKLKY